MEHSLHLGAEHFVKGVAPTSTWNILKRVQHVVESARNDPDKDGDDIAVADDENSDVEFEVADSIGKALALVNQVSIQVLERFSHLTCDGIVIGQICKSLQAQAFFEKSCEEVNAPCLQLLYWVKTRWASLFTFLDRILILQQVRLTLLIISRFSLS